MKKTILWICLMLSINVFAQTPATFDIQGHRGARGLMPENTIPAFLKALELSVDTLELDVVVSSPPTRVKMISNIKSQNLAFNFCFSRLIYHL